tara:strand:- start:278 stop:487 length:210 start_codon:yes stop_codon:yes gene_type:complete
MGKKFYDNDLLINVREEKQHLTIREIAEKHGLKKHQVNYMLYHCSLSDEDNTHNHHSKIPILDKDIDLW